MSATELEQQLWLKPLNNIDEVIYRPVRHWVYNKHRIHALDPLRDLLSENRHQVYHAIKLVLTRSVV